LFKILIADKDLIRAQQIAEGLGRCGFNAAAVKETTGSLKKFIKRHEPDALLLIHSFSEKKILSIIDQARKSGLSIILVAKKDDCVKRLISVLVDGVLEVSSFDNFCQAYGSFLEEKLSILKHEISGKRGISYGMFYADIEKNAIYYGKKRLELTPTEFRIFLVLIMAKGEVVSKTEMLKQIWGIPILNTNTLSVHIQRLRKQLAQLTRKYRIETVRGKGYRLTKI